MVRTEPEQSLLIPLQTELGSLQNSCVEALNPSVTVFGKRAIYEVIKVKLGHTDGAFIPQD